MTAHVAKRAIVQLKVSGSGTSFGEVRSFSIDTNLGTIDVSILSTDWKKYLVGQASWSGNLECFYDPADAAQAALATKVIAGDACELVVMPLGDETGSPTLSGTVYVSSYNITGSTDDAIGLSLSYQGSGELAQGTVS